MYVESLLIAINDQIKSFQITRNVSTATMLSADRASNNTIETKIRNRPQPSIHAASSSSRGSETKNYRKKNTESGVTSDGTINAPSVSISPSCFITKNVEIIVS